MPIQFTGSLDITGSLLLNSTAVTASKSGTVDTGSIMITGSVSGSVFTFEKGDASTFFLELAGGDVNNIQTFTTTGTWVKPSGSTQVMVLLWGAGGGAGSGGIADVAVGNPMSGGGGGGGGCISMALYNATSLPESGSVVVGVGGEGGAAVSASSIGLIDGNPGAAGTSTYFLYDDSDPSNITYYQIANPGNAGSGGVYAGAGIGGAGGCNQTNNIVYFLTNQGRGGTSSTGNVNSSNVGWTSQGGGAGGFTAGGSQGFEPGRGNLPKSLYFFTGSGVVSNAGVSATTSSASTDGLDGSGVIGGIYGLVAYGGGGGGCGSLLFSNGGNGGDGGFPGGGGGGGGASAGTDSPNISGKGGDGGDGLAVIISYF